MEKCRIIRSATRGRSVGFFTTRDSSLKIEQLYRQGDVSIVFPLGTDCDTPTSTCVGPNCRCMNRTISNCATVPCDRYPLVLTPCRSVFICVDSTYSQGQGKTRRFASVLQRRAFTNWTNWSTWHVATCS